jgi:hypothetical protein
VSTVFVSYARDDKARVEPLIRHLPRLGHQVWIDDALRGGQAWWDEILRQIAACDVFLAVVSQASLNSVACRRERVYAHELGRPILPVAVEQLTQAMPRELSLQHVVDYSDPGEDAAFALAGALAGLPPTPPLPDDLPPHPPAPLSYLTDLHEQLETPELTKAQQRQVLDALEPALRSADLEEQRGGRRILELLGARDDLYVDTERRIASLVGAGASGPDRREPVAAPKDPPGRSGPPSPPPRPDRATTEPPGPVGGNTGSETTGPAAPKKRSAVVTTLAVIGGLVVLLVLFAVFASAPEPECFEDEYGDVWCE